MRTSAGLARWLGFVRFSHFARESRGAAAAEMALVFPVIGLVVLNVVDFSVYAYGKMQLDLAAQQAIGLVRTVCDTPAELPATYPANHCSATLSTQMTSAAQQTSLGTGVTLGTMTEGYYCANASGVLVAAGTLSNPSTDCSATVTGSTAKPGLYARVAASYTYVPIFPGVSVMSHIPTNMQKTAWIRLK